MEEFVDGTLNGKASVKWIRFDLCVTLLNSGD